MEHNKLIRALNCTTFFHWNSFEKILLKFQKHVLQELKRLGKLKKIAKVFLLILSFGIWNSELDGKIFQTFVEKVSSNNFSSEKLFKLSSFMQIYSTDGMT